MTNYSLDILFSHSIIGHFIHTNDFNYYLCADDTKFTSSVEAPIVYSTCEFPFAGGISNFDRQVSKFSISKPELTISWKQFLQHSPT